MPNSTRSAKKREVFQTLLKRQKNDATDAEAIVVAARQPEMRFVSPKSEEQQARAAIFRSRERLVRQRTELMNALRGLLYEYGAVFPVGLNQTKRIEAYICGSDAELPYRPAASNSAAS